MKLFLYEIIAISSEPIADLAGSGATDSDTSIRTDFQTDQPSTTSQEPLTTTTQNGQRGDTSQNQSGEIQTVVSTRRLSLLCFQATN